MNRIKKQLQVLFLHYLLTALLKTLFKTCRVIVLSENDFLKKSKEPYVYAHWHQSIASLIVTLYHSRNPDQELCFMISPSPSGNILAHILAKTPYTKTLRGSRHKGFLKAFKETIRYLKSGTSTLVPIDGSRGPYRDIKDGIFKMSILSNRPIVPITLVPSHYWTMQKAWDKQRIPKPFSKIYVHYGEPIQIRKDDEKDLYQKTKEIIRRQLEESEKKIFDEFINTY